VDPEAVVLALVDVAEDDSRRELDPVLLDAFCELLAQYQAGNAKTIATVHAAIGEIYASPRCLDILGRVANLFRPGFPLQDPSIRASRKQAVIDFFEMIKPVLPKLLNKIEWRQDWEERNQARRYCLMSRPDLVQSAGEVCSGTPEEVLAVAAGRTFEETKKEISPEALAALHAYLWGGGRVTQTEAARSAGVSPSTLTRALDVLREKTNCELGPASEVERIRFAAALRIVALRDQKGTQ
jgi:hypothetical protein